MHSVDAAQAVSIFFGLDGRKAVEYKQLRSGAPDFRRENGGSGHEPTDDSLHAVRRKA
jgi:hypothetical protein